MSHMTIEVEFLGGTDIKTAIREAKELATKLDISYVCFDFNGTSFSIGKNVNINKVIKEHHEHIGGPIIFF